MLRVAHVIRPGSVERVGDMKPTYIDRTTNLFGPTEFAVRQRLRAVLHAPSQATWNDAYRITLSNASHLTLWQAVCRVDSEFPSTRARRDAPWPRIPDQLTIARAIRYAVTRRPRVVSKRQKGER